MDKSSFALDAYETFLDAQERKRNTLSGILQIRTTLGCELEVLHRRDECPSKFQVVYKRWIVERSLAWLENFIRLVIDYEFQSESTVAMTQMTFCFLMLNKIFH